MRKLVALVLVVLGVLLVTPAAASASTPTLKSFAKTVAALQKQVKTLNAKVTKDESLLAAVEPYVKVTKATVNGVKGPNIILQGVNLQIRSATAESDTSGLGNLIVGWDDEPATTQRSGSNNLVCGDYNSFASYGCFLAGFFNAVSGIGASVSGGADNLASNACASVSGGEGNQATGYEASVSGGENNRATGSEASVSGGEINHASNVCASVSGGESNQATADWASVSGGGSVAENTAEGWSAGGTFHNP